MPKTADERIHRIYCLMGKSASGKDTIYRRVKERAVLEGRTDLREVIPYTTRPIRSGEENGVTYFYENNEQFETAKAAGKIIESRDYNTVYGIWHYYTKDDGQICLDESSYLIIGTLESYESIAAYYGRENVVPLYIELEAGERLERALKRERQEAVPRYAELCRRFLADEQDFSEDKLKAAGITRRYRNEEIHQCVDEVWKTICRKSDLNQ